MVEVGSEICVEIFFAARADNPSTSLDRMLCDSDDAFDPLRTSASTGRTFEPWVRLIFGTQSGSFVGVNGLEGLDPFSSSSLLGGRRLERTGRPVE